jgi:parallel beta-helix repeat protein
MGIKFIRELLDAVSVSDNDYFVVSQPDIAPNGETRKMALEKLKSLVPGRKAATLVVGTALSGHTLAEVDYLCDGTDDQAEINAAIQALPVGGGKISIREGTYNIAANIIIDIDNVTIEGMGASTVLRRMYDEPSASGLMNVTGSYVTVKDLQIDGNKGSYSSTNNRGINISGSGHVVTGNTCNNDGTGIQIAYAGSNTTVTGNTCNNDDVGINISGSGHVVTGNTCNNNNVVGINISGSGHVVTGNTCCNNNTGIQLAYASSNSTVTGNTCNNNNVGISVGGANSTVTGNTCNNNNVGINVGGANSTVTGNTCNNNNVGINISGSGHVVTGNTCCNNNTGIQLAYASSNSTVTGNTCVRGTGLPADYSASQNTIVASGPNNLIVGNNILGKNYVNNGGATNTFANNKYN